MERDFRGGLRLSKFSSAYLILIVQIKVSATGNTGHASRFIEGTAVEQLIGVSNRALAFREEQRKILHGAQSDACGCSHSIAAKKTLGDVTSLNLTMIKTSGGDTGAYNVVPARAEAVFDIRISPHVNPMDIASKLDKWCSECSIPGTEKSIEWSLVSHKMMEHQTTSIDPSINPWWPIFSDAIRQHNNEDIKIEPMVFPAATDSRLLRAIGVRAFGFSPIRRSPILLHEHNEFLEVSVFLEGCDVYISLIKSLASQPRFSGDV
jgi:aminoacylase